MKNHFSRTVFSAAFMTIVFLSAYCLTTSSAPAQGQNVGQRRPQPPRPVGQAPIVEIQFQTSKSSQIAKRSIPGFELLDFDLNKGMGGGTDFIYLFYRRSWNERPITGLHIIVGEHARPPVGFTKISTDLNKGAGADYLYLCYTQNPNLRPVTGLSVLYQNNRPSTQGWWNLIDVNLNKGGGRRGDNIFLWYKQ